MNESVLPINIVQATEKRSKIAIISLALGITSILLGLFPALLGLLIRVLKAFEVLPREGTIGFGGLLGIFSLLIGLPFAFFALILGIKTGRKIKNRLAPITDKTRSRIGISAALITVIAVPILCVCIFLLSDFGFLYRVQHFLVQQGIASPPVKPDLINQNYIKKEK